MRKLVWGSCAALVVALAVIAAVAMAPALVALVCPACFGFAPLADSVYVERGMAPATRRGVDHMVQMARSRVATFYGARIGDPRIFVCQSDVCYQRIGGGGSAGMAVLNLALFLGPRGATQTIATHELSHIELHARIGLVKTIRRDVPQWFDEGIAVVVSDDPRYLAPPSAADRCLASPGGDLPMTRAAWVETAAHAQLYAKAACRVSGWITAHGGPSAVSRLLTKVADGVAFEDAYR